MPKEQSPEKIGIDSIKTFSELFSFLNSQTLDKEHRDAYEEAANIAKDLIATKTKSNWNASSFESAVTSKYPSITRDFVSTLRRCIENYNPPVNVPDKPLWE